MIMPFKEKHIEHENLWKCLRLIAVFGTINPILFLGNDMIIIGFERFENEEP